MEVIRSFLEQFLNELQEWVPEHPLDREAILVPELYSGNECSPLLLVAQRPKGGTGFYKVAEARQNHNRYPSYYRVRYRRCTGGNGASDVFGRNLSPTARTLWGYAELFGQGAGVAASDQWKLLWKSNAFADPEDWTGPGRRKVGDTTGYPLGEWIRKCIDTYQPAFVVTFGKDAPLALKGLPFIDGDALAKETDEKIAQRLRWTGDQPVYVRFSNHPSRPPAAKVTDKVFRSLGRAWQGGPAGPLVTHGLEGMPLPEPPELPEKDNNRGTPKRVKQDLRTKLPPRQGEQHSQPVRGEPAGNWVLVTCPEDMPAWLQESAPWAFDMAASHPTLYGRDTGRRLTVAPYKNSKKRWFVIAKGLLRVKVDPNDKKALHDTYFPKEPPRSREELLEISIGAVTELYRRDREKFLQFAEDSYQSHTRWG